MKKAKYMINVGKHNPDLTPTNSTHFVDVSVDFDENIGWSFVALT